jgi:hypothetical protein
MIAKKGTGQIDVKISASERANGRFGRFFEGFLASSTHPPKGPPAYVWLRLARVARFGWKTSENTAESQRFRGNRPQHSAFLSV